MRWERFRFNVNTGSGMMNTHSGKSRKVDLFREQSTVDELGIGTVRDALADGLFPGISTIQTLHGSTSRSRPVARSPVMLSAEKGPGC